MVIFNSYVKLPEGNHRLSLQDPAAAASPCACAQGSRLTTPTSVRSRGEKPGRAPLKTYHTKLQEMVILLGIHGGFIGFHSILVVRLGFNGDLMGIYWHFMGV